MSAWTAFCRVAARLGLDRPKPNEELELEPVFREFSVRKRVEHWTEESSAARHPERYYSATIVIAEFDPGPQGKSRIVITRAVCEELLSVTIAAAASAFRTMVIAADGLDRLNPYQTFLPVLRPMYKGRKAEERQLTRRNCSWALLGPRRAGKSSLARVACAKMAQTKRWDGAYIDVTRMDASFESLCALILDSLPIPERELRHRERGLTRFVGHAPEEDALRRYLRSTKNKIFLVIDELDGLVVKDRDAGWRVFDALKEFIYSRERQFRVVMVGYRDFAHALADDKFPFYGHLEEMTLQYLDRDETTDLVLGPLGALGITVSTPDDVAARVWHATGGMPAVVQKLCGAVVSRAATAQATKFTVTEAAIDEIIRKARIYDRHVSFIRRRATTEREGLQRLFLALACQSDAVNLDEFHAAATNHASGSESSRIGASLDETRDALHDLAVRGILVDLGEADRYAVSIPAAREALQADARRVLESESLLAVQDE